MKNHFAKITLNFLAVILLAGLLSLPLFFAANFAKVAGEKTSAEYLIVPHADNFPNLDITGENEKYLVSFTPVGVPQAFLGIMTLANPANTPKTYSLEESAPDVEVFFGQDPQNHAAKITLPPHAQTPISLFSQSASHQNITFTVGTE